MKPFVLTGILQCIINQRPNSKKNMCMGPHAGVDYNLTLCPLQSRPQHIYHGQPYARVDLNPTPEPRVDFISQSGTLNLASEKNSLVILTESQSGNGHFLANIPYDVKSAQLGEGGGCTSSPFHCIYYHHEQSCGVRSSWEGKYTPPVSPLPL